MAEIEGDRRWRGVVDAHGNVVDVELAIVRGLARRGLVAGPMPDRLQAVMAADGLAE